MIVSCKCDNCGYESNKHPFKEFNKLQEEVQKIGGYVGYHKGDKCPICHRRNELRMIQ